MTIVVPRSNPAAVLLRGLMLESVPRPPGPRASASSCGTFALLLLLYERRMPSL